MTYEDRVAAGKALVAYTDTLNEIMRIAQSIKEAREAICLVVPRCAICNNDDCEDCCIADNAPIVRVGTIHGSLTTLTDSEMDSADSICNRLLHTRIANGIKRLRELIATLESSSPQLAKGAIGVA